MSRLTYNNYTLETDASQLLHEWMNVWSNMVILYVGSNVPVERLDWRLFVPPVTHRQPTWHIAFGTPKPFGRKTKNYCIHLLMGDGPNTNSTCTYHVHAQHTTKQLRMSFVTVRLIANILISVITGNWAEYGSNEQLIFRVLVYTCTLCSWQCTRMCSLQISVSPLGKINYLSMQSVLVYAIII